jgi:hypothetical protein
VGDLPLVVACGFGEFQAALDAHTLTGGALYHVAGVPGNGAANGIMDRVRAYRC